MHKIENKISSNISWLQSMKQKGGYGGPVVHYWQDCLRYIGPGTDWRYEGLVQAFLELHKKTGQEEFLSLAIECGDFLVGSQQCNGTFFNSGFEANPTFSKGSTPHDSTVNTTLLKLASALKEKELQWEKYYQSAMKNYRQFHLGKLFIKQKGLFAQYPKENAARVPNAFVPNKMASIIEMLLEMNNISKDNELVKLAVKNAEFILKMQETEISSGGIFQANNKNKIITIYNARCVPPLLKLFDETGNYKLLESALLVCKFIKKMENPEGGFDFGYLKSGGELKKFRFPVFIAGSSEIIRALIEAKKYDSSIKVKGKNTDFILENMLRSGGIKTSQGMLLKNSEETKIRGESWRDVLPATGWNDKALRLLAMQAKKNSHIELYREFTSCSVNCIDGKYSEDQEKIVISGNENFLFSKNKMFEGDNTMMKKILFSSFSVAKRLGIKSSVGSKIMKYMGVK